MINNKFGRLTVIRKTDKKQRREFLYECLCDCGNSTYQTSCSLKSGHVKSCGCLQKEQASGIAQAQIVDGTRPERMLNDKANKNNKTGVKGVAIYQQSGKTKYKASLYYKGKNYSKRGFLTLEEATEYRKELEEKYLKDIKK